MGRGVRAAPSERARHAPLDSPQVAARSDASCVMMHAGHRTGNATATPSPLGSLVCTREHGELVQSFRAR
jgi:hypothetical protein